MRKIERNKIRRKYGNKGLKSIWRTRQLKKYGKEKLSIMYKLCSPKKSHELKEVF